MKDNIQEIIEKAKASKHTDAILFLIENKSDIANKVQIIAKSIEGADLSEKEQEQIKFLKKMIAIVSEYVFNNCVEVLSNDKKDE